MEFLLDLLEVDDLVSVELPPILPVELPPEPPPEPPPVLSIVLPLEPQPELPPEPEPQPQPELPPEPEPPFELRLELPPEPQPEYPPEPQPEPPPQMAVSPEEFPQEEYSQEEPPSEGLLFAEQVFDLNNISEILFETTKTDIQALIQELDSIIRAKNYNAWLGYLSESYLEEISSSAFLEERTEELFRRDQIVAAATGKDPRTVQKKTLKTLRDYFDNVVAPSRANDRVDDIAFISETKVRAYTVNNRGTRLILYDLEKIGESWKIIG